MAQHVGEPLDVREEAPKGWHRLAPGAEVRLRYAALIRCREVVKDAAGNVTELRCTWDPDSRGGRSPDGRKVKGTLHWVSAAHAVKAEVRLYDRLFTRENPLDVPEGQDYKDFLNPDSLTVLHACLLEPSLANAQPGDRVQFERMGYFFADPKLSKPGALVWNRVVTLKDTWAKLEGKLAKTPEPPAKASPAASVATADAASAPRPDRKPQAPEIEYADFAKVDLRVATIREAGLVEGADKLLCLKVDLGEGRLRQIFAGIRKSYQDPAALVGKQVVVVANLKPRKMRFGLSEGMVLSGVGGTAENEILCVPTFERAMDPGDTVS